MKRKAIVLLALLLVMNLALVLADGDHDEIFEQAEQIIKQKIPCSELSERQLEILGDYYMEQMHPGESHEVMDKRMGGEGSESLRQAHINMGLAFYCGEHGEISGGMMNTMMGRGMMGGYSGGMMGSYYGSSGFGYLNWVLTVLIIMALVLLIIFLIKKLSEKPRRNK